MSGRAGVRHRPRLTFWLTFFLSYMLPLFFSGMLSYLVGMQRRTSRCIPCKRDNSRFLHYLKNRSIMPLGVFLVFIFFLFLHKSLCCGYSVKAFQQGNTIEYPQHMLPWRNEKNINTFQLKNLPYLEILSYDYVCLSFTEIDICNMIYFYFFQNQQKYTGILGQDI